MKTVGIILLLLLLLGPGMLDAQQLTLPERIKIGGLDGLDPNQPDSSYRIALALSGGGARGLSTIGLLKAFEEKNIEITGIAGTSIGGIVGGLYACGYTPDQMDSIITSISFSELFSNRPQRRTMFLSQREARERHLLSIRFDGLKPEIPQGLTTGQELSAILSHLTSGPVYRAGGDFAKLPIPYLTVGTDIVSGNKVIFTSGSMAVAIRATIAFPLAFTGVEHGDQILMDGGMVSPIPVVELKGMVPPGTFVVAVNSTSPLADKDHLNTPVDIANQVTTIMTQDRLDYQLSLADYILTPDIGEATLTDIDRAREFIQAGYKAGLTEADRIIAKLREIRPRNMFEVNRVVPFSESSADESSIKAALMLSELLNGKRADLEQLQNLARAVGRELDLFSLELITVPIADKKDFVAIQVKAQPSLKISDLQISFNRNQLISDSALYELLVGQSKRLNSRTLRDGLTRILDSYHDQGHDLARIARAELNANAKQVQIDIDEGLIRQINVSQNEVSRDWLVRSYLPMKVGEPWTEAKAAEGIDNIYGSDLFDRVGLELTPTDSGAIVTIEVQEKKHTQLRLGWHWHDVYQSEEFVEILNDNLRGTGMEFLMHASAGQDRQNYYLQLRANRIFSTFFTARTRLYYNRIERSIYDSTLSLAGERDERRWGLSFELGRHYSRLGTLSAELVLEELEYRDSRDDSRQRFGLRTLVFESLVETFDRATFPNSGKKHLFQLSFYGKTAGGDLTVFSRYYNSIESYLPLGHGLNYHPKLVLGFSRTGLPASEKFFLGGMKSFSGYKDHQQTGDKVLAINQELRLGLPHSFYLTARYDLGDLWASADDVKLDDLQHGWGGSIAFDSPVGPFEFGYGKAKDGPELYYFYAGFEF